METLYIVTRNIGRLMIVDVNYDLASTEKQGSSLHIRPDNWKGTSIRAIQQSQMSIHSHKILRKPIEIRDSRRRGRTMMMDKSGNSNILSRQGNDSTRYCRRVPYLERVWGSRQIFLESSLQRKQDPRQLIHPIVTGELSTKI